MWLSVCVCVRCVWNGKAFVRFDKNETIVSRALHTLLSRLSRSLSPSRYALAFLLIILSGVAFMKFLLLINWNRINKVTWSASHTLTRMQHTHVCACACDLPQRIKSFNWQATKLTWPLAKAAGTIHTHYPSCFPPPPHSLSLSALSPCVFHSLLTSLHFAALSIYRFAAVATAMTVIFAVIVAVVVVAVFVAASVAAAAWCCCCALALLNLLLYLIVAHFAQLFDCVSIKFRCSSRGQQSVAIASSFIRSIPFEVKLPVGEMKDVYGPQGSANLICRAKVKLDFAKSTNQ